MNVIENYAGKRRADDTGHRKAGEEKCDGAGLFFLAIPVGEIEKHAGKISGFGDAEQKADCQQLVNAVDEASKGGEEPPGKEDAGDPDTCADFVHQEIAGNFKGGVAEEEDAGNQSELLTSDSDLAVH